MAYCADMAEEAQERALIASRAYRKPVIRVTGRCLNCGEVCDGVYCMAECREDHSNRKNARARNG